MSLVIGATTSLQAQAGPAAAATPAAEAVAGTALGVNIAPVRDWTPEWPFVDAFRTSRPWISQRTGASWGQGPALSLDEHGWVRSMEPGQYVDAAIFTSGDYPIGTYAVTWEGTGDVTFFGGGTISDRTANRFEYNPQTAGRADYTTGAGGRFLRITRTDPDDYVRNIRVWMPGFEQTGEKQVFHPQFLDSLKGMRTLRFMDWMTTNASPYAEWEDYPTPESSTQTRGVAVELMVELANRVGADPWFNMPHRATDEFVRSFAQVVQDRLAPGRKAYIEYSNELWNSAYAFQQTPWVRRTGQDLGLAVEPWVAGQRYQALRSVEIFRLWREAFGAEADTRLVRVMGVQSGNSGVARDVLAYRDTHEHVDAIAVAPYFDCGDQWIPGDSRTYFPGHPTVAPYVKAGGVDRLLQACQHSIDTGVREQILRHKALADQYGLSLVAYEAGQHLTGLLGTENDSALTALFHAANRHPRMRDLYARYLDQWRELGGGTIALFLTAEHMSKWGSWGLRERMNQALADAPKARAADEFLQALRQLPLRVAAPTVTSLSLRAGLSAGGATVTLRGANLASTSTVRFGGVSAPFRTAQVSGVTHLVVTTPRFDRGGVVDVAVSNPAGTSTPTSASRFTYHPPPVVTSLSPSTALTVGGTTVTLTGTALTGTTEVRIGAVAAPSVRVLSPTSVQFAVPARIQTGGVDVTVTTPYGTSAVVPAGRLTYVNPPRPVVADLSAASGPAQVPTTVLINGSNFRGATRITIGVQEATFTVLSDSQIRAVFPPQPHNTWVNVHVFTPGGHSDAHAETDFRYIAAQVPSVTGLSAASGQTHAPHTVLVNGQGFTWASRVTVGGVTVPFTFVSDTQLRAAFPARTSTGLANVQVSTPAGASPVTQASGFAYTTPPRPVVSRLSATRGLTAARTPVTIEGTGFTAASKVSVGGVSVAFTRVSDTRLSLVLPIRAAGTAYLQVTTPGGTSATGNGTAFTWVRSL
ncbi:IPT/TIG domain-containing protein [Planomonospora sp. ID67723]|uniref:IPT/TIG domain-containing protein n=1 Tax=Planomonospora sp. ID67723 TaxID=2738134 RepID=UPI0018C4434F|nr:IPT/TIG domain-containing protein [Planomonospora sp. ID67723]MBG0826931.1 IPT/TIG domain-containing protein [Planomonospora sp. ID67723]